MWALAFTTFIVGCLLGWLVAWMLQRRLDDSLTAQVTQLQQELDECKRNLSATERAVLPESAEAPAAEQERAPEAAVETAAGQEAAGEPVAGEEIEETIAEETGTEEEAASTARADAGIAAAATAVAEEEAETLEGEAEAVEETRADEDAAAAAAAAETTVTDRDEEAADLTVIKGIGPKFAEILTAAGITSYAALAESTPEQLQEIVQPAPWQKVDFEDWIAQAAVLARQSRHQIGGDLT